jgi:pimeloyl-ACP methyl ester carboxylesterase
VPTTAAADGTRIAYDVEGTGPPLVLIHGLPEARREWDPIVDRLAGDFTCVRPDLRGQGESEPARTDHSTFRMAADVAAVVGATGIEPPLLVGHSNGAIVATICVATGAPARGVVNVDQSLRMAEFAAIARPFEDAFRGPDFNEIFGAFIASLGLDLLPAQDAERIRAYSRAVPPEVVLEVWDPLFTSTDEELTTLVERDVLGHVRLPYLCLFGAEPGADYRDWLTSRVPTATIEVWGGDGHWLHLVEPDRFADRIRTFAAAI